MFIVILNSFRRITITLFVAWLALLLFSTFNLFISTLKRLNCLILDIIILHLFGVSRWKEKSWICNLQFVFPLDMFKKLIWKYFQYGLVKTNQNIIRKSFHYTRDTEIRYLIFSLYSNCFCLNNIGRYLQYIKQDIHSQDLFTHNLFRKW